MDDEKIVCEICGETGFDYKETMYNHPRYAESEEHEKVCELCFLGGMNLL